MKCHQCHQTIEVNAKFCPFCGSAIEQEKPAQVSRRDIKAQGLGKN